MSEKQTAIFVLIVLIVGYSAGIVVENICWKAKLSVHGMGYYIERDFWWDDFELYNVSVDGQLSHKPEPGKIYNIKY